MNDDERGERSLWVTRLTVLLVMGTILSCMVVVVLSGVFALRSIGKSEELQRQAELAQVAAEMERDRVRFEADDLRAQTRCRAAVAAANDVVVLDLLDVLSGIAEAELRGLSTGALADQMTAARAQLVEAKVAREAQSAECGS